MNFMMMLNVELIKTVSQFQFFSFACMTNTEAFESS